MLSALDEKARLQHQREEEARLKRKQTREREMAAKSLGLPSNPAIMGRSTARLPKTQGNNNKRKKKSKRGGEEQSVEIR
jgi:hypothetical protein